jgi:hypothetical protein
MNTPRLTTKPFPSYIFVPGKNPHPKKAGGHMEGMPDPVVPQLDPNHPEKSETLRFSLDLYNHGYFWESHVYFEALWNAHGRQGKIADFLKAMIKLGAAGVKIQLGEMKNARDHFNRALELFESLEVDSFLGFDVIEIETLIEESIESGKNPKILPTWK